MGNVSFIIANHHYRGEQLKVGPATEEVNLVKPPAEIEGGPGSAKVEPQAVSRMDTIVPESDTGSDVRVIRQLDGVQYVVPEGYDSYEEYMEAFRSGTISGTDKGRLGIMPDPQPMPLPDYSFSGIMGMDGHSSSIGHDWLAKNLAYAVGDDYFTRAFEFFRSPGDIGENYAETRSVFLKQAEAAYAERKDQIAAGKGDGFETLTSMVTLQGQDMTVGELEKVRQIFVNANEAIGVATEKKYMGNLKISAILGLSVASVKKQIAESGISADVAKWAVDMFEKRINIWGQQHMESMEYKKPKAGTEAYNNSYYAVINFDFDDPYSFNADAYHKFAQIDIGDQTSLEQSFNEALDWYVKGTQEWYRMNWGTSGSKEEISRFLDDMKSYFL